TRCKGARVIYSKETAKQVLWDFRSPRWRARDTALTDWEAEFAAWEVTDWRKVAPKTWKLDRVDLLDDAHGVAVALEGKQAVPRESKGIRATEPPTKPAEWSHYEECADGPWPDSGAGAAGPHPAPQPAPQPGPAPEPAPAPTADPEPAPAPSPK